MDFGGHESEGWREQSWKTLEPREVKTRCKEKLKQPTKYNTQLECQTLSAGCRGRKQGKGRGENCVSEAGQIPKRLGLFGVSEIPTWGVLKALWHAFVMPKNVSLGLKQFFNSPNPTKVC